MCIICDKKFDADHLHCNGCSKITFIPQMNNLTFIDCSNCPNLRYISYQPNLEFLNARNCKSLRYFGSFPNIEYLDMSYTKISYINSNMIKLSVLKCSGCNISEIPKLNIQTLECCDCRHLIRVFHSSTIENIMCMDCPRIEDLFFSRQGKDNIKILVCRACPLLYIPKSIRSYFPHTVFVSSKYICRLRKCCRFNDEHV